MRKLVAAAAMAGMAAMVMTGCGKKAETQTTAAATVESAAKTEAETEKTAESAAETVKETEAETTAEKTTAEETAAESKTAEKTDAAETETAGETAEETADEAKADQKTFTVGFDAEFPPYGYRDESGEYVGFDLDLAAEVCGRQGWELVKQPIDWDAKDMELSSGAISCIWNGFTMNGREDEYTWSDPYIDNSQVFVVASDSGIKDKADLAGKVVAVQKDSSALAALNDEENADNIALRDSFSQLIEYADYNTAFMDLEQGAVDSVAIDLGVAEYQIAKREEGAYVMLEGDDNKLASEQYAVGFLKGNTELRDEVQNTLDEMVADGTFMEIADKWGLSDSVCLGK